MAEAEQPHPIFDDIEQGDLGAVQQRVLADAAVLEERTSYHPQWTPLMAAISHEKPAIALWLIQHRGQHDVDTDDDGWTALHRASNNGPLDVVRALVAAGANPAALTAGSTPLIFASRYGHTDIVAFLLQQPAVKASIDAINRYPNTALSLASTWGHQPTVQLLLDAGADPTIPAGQRSPVNRALNNDNHAVAALLSHTIDEADRVRMCVALMGTRKGLYKHLYLEVLGYMLPAWAAKGRADEDSESSEEEGSESSSEEGGDSGSGGE